jgi:predicted membrane protein
VYVDYVIRFIAGGAVVSVFAVLGDLWRPKSFAGLFGAAPAVALATLTLGFWKEGSAYVAVEGRSMVLGALGMALYSIVVCQLLVRARMSALTATICAMAVWLASALSLKHMLVG